MPLPSTSHESVTSSRKYPAFRAVEESAVACPKGIRDGGEKGHSLVGSYQGINQLTSSAMIETSTKIEAEQEKFKTSIQSSSQVQPAQTVKLEVMR